MNDMLITSSTYSIQIVGKGTASWRLDVATRSHLASITNFDLNRLPLFFLLSCVIVQVLLLPMFRARSKLFFLLLFFFFRTSFYSNWRMLHERKYRLHEVQTSSGRPGCVSRSRSSRHKMCIERSCQSQQSSKCGAQRL